MVNGQNRFGYSTRRLKKDLKISYISDLSTYYYVPWYHAKLKKKNHLSLHNDAGVKLG